MRAQDILKRAAKRCEQAEVFQVWRQETPVSFEANRLKMLETKETSGLALRIIKNGRLGLSATNDPDDIEGLIERAVELSVFGPVAKFDLPGPVEYVPARAYNQAAADAPVDAMVETGQGMIDALRAGNQELVCEGGVTKAVSRVEITNTTGLRAAHKRTTYALGLHGTLIRGTDMLFVGDYATSCKADADPNKLVARVREQLDWAKETVPAPTKAVPVVFHPHAVASALLSPLTTALNGRTVLQGASPLQGKLGKRLFDKRFSLWDDSTVNMRPASRGFDDEGVPTRKISLVEDGVPLSFLYDLQTAGLSGKQSTGSASRGLASLPSPSTSLLMVKTGDATFAQMIAGIKDGLLIHQLLGAGQGNVLGGEFGGNVLLGYRIQKGEVVGRVKDTMVSGNVYDVLKKIVAIGKKAEWVGGSLFTPAICCEGVTISSKA